MNISNSASNPSVIVAAHIGVDLIPRFYLPPFAYWSPPEWASKGPDVGEIVAGQLGWDITDFGQGDYANFGLFLFTIRLTKSMRPALSLHSWRFGPWRAMIL